MICRSSASSASRRRGVIGQAFARSAFVRHVVGQGRDRFAVSAHRPPLDPSDIEAAGAQLVFHPLETAIQVIDAADRRLTFGHKTGDDQRHGGAKVRRHDRRALQPLDAAHHGLACMDGDVRAQARQFRRVHEAVLEDVLVDDAFALGRRHQRHELRLQVGGEARIDLGRDVDRLQPLRRVATHDQAVLRRFDLDARLDHLVGQGGDQVGAALGQAHLAPAIAAASA